jgi:oligo-1,6-glucosidase
MPDLNWENPDCRRAIYNSSMRFWLERGIDGFRIDTVNKYSKDITFPDAHITDPNEVTQPAMKHYSNGPRMREFLLEMNDVFDKYDIFTVGELPNTPLGSDVMAYVSTSKRQLNMVFNFDLVSLGQTLGNRLVPVPFSTCDVKRQLSRWQTFVNGTDAWTTVFLENHDQGRSISRFGSDSEHYRERSGKMLAMILSSMTGTLFVYQGQEIGMTNAPKSWGAEEYKDIRSVNFYEQIRERSGGDKGALKKALDGMQKVASDHARLPMQWDGSPNAGFTSESVKPWMRVNDNFAHVNVEQQIRDEKSLLSFWKRLIKLRKKYKDIFVYGRYELCDTDDEDLFIFIKMGSGMTSLTVANMSETSK